MSVTHSTVARSGPMGWSRTLSTAVLVAAAGVSIVALLSLAGTDSLGWDFRYTYLRAAELVRDGGSPYPELADEILASGTAYVYPPQLAVVLAPVSDLPDDLVVWLAFVGALASLVAALAMLGVRDIRCYAAFLAWGATSSALEMTNVTAFLVLGVACIWRYRTTIWPLAAALGLAVATKLFLWPLAVWAIATDRRRALVRAVGLGVGVVFVSWAVVGFDDLTRYPELLKRFAEVQGEVNSYSIAAVVVAAGGSSLAGQVVTVLVGGPLVVASLYFGRRLEDDERSFIAAVGAALLLTPVAWLHYYVLLAVPLAIARPRFSLLWLLPIVLWLCPRDGNGDVHVVVPTVVALTVLVALLVRPRAEPALSSA